MQKVTFGAGCFWGVEEEFRKTAGVNHTVVGYMGGWKEDPSYEDVCAGNTGHAEVVQVTFDDSLMTFNELLDVFFAIHDPTTKDQQGPDIGSQYRSVIFFHSPEQKKLAEDKKFELNKAKRFPSPVVTEITKASTFYPAEDYHQKYYERLYE
ncbi:MAG: peptide-methionine (S)-S-oxide reductase MsrA [Candidatus Omnitrophica bacterium]|nr:peptide-methionine (S)-S-oxide reductase MsrA [Candidatus Omnitrophota bacterium]